MKHYLPSEELQRDVVAEIQAYYKAELGRFNIKQYYKNNQFDKGSFTSLCSCSYCQQSFNPFYTNSLKVKTEWNWGATGKPEKQYKVNCPNCSNELRFTVFID